MNVNYWSGGMMFIPHWHTKCQVSSFFLDTRFSTALADTLHLFAVGDTKYRPESSAECASSDAYQTASRDAYFMARI